MKKTRSFLAILIALLAIIYMLGPKPPKPVLNPDLNDLGFSKSEIETVLAEREKRLPVKPGNESRVIWENDSLKQQTKYCLLYLHGFSASGVEGAPTHENFAKHFQMNAYIPRLASHGLDVPEPLLDMTPDRLYESAKEALQIAHLLGQKVIIMSTSTGGTLSLKLAADFPELVDGLLLLSPNIRINNPGAFLLAKPWGLQISRMVTGDKYRYVNDNLEDEECKYWNCYYRMEATVYLQQLVEATMHKKTYEHVKAPVFLAYYYEDEEHQDGVVRVDAMLKMFDQLGTPTKQKQAFNAGVHVIGYGVTSKAQPEVEQACIDFAQKVIGLSQ